MCDGEPSKQVSLERRSPAHWCVTFDIPPLNIFGPQNMAPLTAIVAAQADLPSDAEIQPEWDAFMASLARPGTQARIKKLMERGFHKPGDVETRLGYHVGQLGR